MVAEKYINLGKTDILVSTLGLGVMQWGYKSVNKQFGKNTENSICNIYKAYLELGVNFFDTAEIYGNGLSETRLGECHTLVSDDVVIASKFMPFPWRLSKGELRKASIHSMRRLGVDKIDLYQMHWPFPPISINTWMDAMADLIADGLIRAVGVSNYSVSQTRKACDQLRKYNIPLASNQIKYSLLHRDPERQGLIALCQNLGITVIAYSPLSQGILTGKYSQYNLPTDYRSFRYNKGYITRVEPLFNELHKIGEEHGGKTPGQVSLNWLISKGTIPIPGAKNISQARENAGALGWRLTADEVEKLDNISKELST